MPYPSHAFQSSEGVIAAGHRLTALSAMLSKGELLVVRDTHLNRKGIVEHSSSINGDVALPRRFCTVQAEKKPSLTWMS